MTSLKPFRQLIVLIVALWAIHLLNLVSADWLMMFGLEPRRFRGLDGIIAAPLLHGSFSHLMSNTMGMAVLGGLVCLHGARTFVRVSVFVTLVAGLVTWCVAREGLHVGASSLIFGYFGYLLGRGYVERTPKALIIAVIVVIFYGGLIWGVLPTQRGISWEGHLFGALAGFLAARTRIHTDAASP